MRKTFLGLLLAVMFLVMLTPSALALDRREGSRLTVAAGETVEDDLLLTGVAVAIDGTVKGDVIAFAESVTVTGTIEGNLVAAANSVDVHGRVTGTLYTAAEDLLITGDVGRSVVSAVGNGTIEKSAAIGRNWISGGDQLRSDGRIGLGVLAGASQLQINGPVAGDVEAAVESLTFGREAAVDGSVTYRSEHDAAVEDGARVGEMERIPVRRNFRRDMDFGPFRSIGMAVQFVGFVIVGLIVLALLPRLRFSFQQAVVEKPWQTPLIGLVILLVVPIASVLLMVTVIGIPLGFVSLLLYPLAIYLGQVLLSWTAGRLIADRWAWLGSQHWAMIFLIGAIVTTILTALPFVDFAFGFLAVVYGLGGLYYALSRKGDGLAA